MPAAKAKKLILVVDDEPAICWAFERMFSQAVAEVVSKSSAEEGLNFVQERRPDLILLDVRLPQQDGISALPEFRRLASEAPVIIMTAFGDLETAVAALQNGASDYLTKPFELKDARRSCEAALESAGSRPEEKNTGSPEKTRASGESKRGEIIGSSPAIQQIFKQIALVADSDLSVLITGETGTGKELVAAAIHRHSPRRDAPYLPIAPVALNSDLIESELFGHVAGAFTGAVSDRAGVFEQAEGGTVLLDEIGDLPLGTQVKLLRVLDQQEYFRVGDVRPRPCNVRILAATNCDLQQAVQDGSFREDLFYRLNGLRMHLPPLRERLQDIPALCKYFLSSLNYRGAAFTEELLAQVVARPWNGNIRELRNAIEHAAVLARGRAITLEDFPAPQPSREHLSNQGFESVVQDWFADVTKALGEHHIGLHEALLSEIEPILFRLALKHTGDNRSKAAELLGIHRATLREKLRSFDIE